MAGDLENAAGWFYGIEEGVCRFGVAHSSLRNEESLIGTLGHEVAHAYRTFHGLQVPTAAIEEKLTDLTTVYLGFGFFTLQSSFQFETGHYSDRGERLLFERRTLGYLSPGQLAFLLAARLKVHPRGKHQLQEAAEALTPNHAVALREAFDSLPPRAALLRLLELPPEHEWPAPRELAAWQPPLPPAKVRVRDHGEAAKKLGRRRNIAFRVTARRTLEGIILGGGLGVVGTMLFEQATFLLAAPVLGYFLGRLVRVERCSSCQRAVAPKAQRCDFCDARLVGVIAHVNDRIEAEERYWAKRGKG